MLPESVDCATAHAEACHAKFRALVDGTSPNVYDHSFLITNYLLCCPHDSDAAGAFCTLAFRYLVDTPWRKKYIMSLFGQASVRLPHVLGPQGLPFLRILREQCSGSSLPSSSAMYLVYARLAEQLLQSPTPLSSTSKTEVQTVTDISVDRDAGMRLLIHGLWTYNPLRLDYSGASLVGQDEARLVADNQGSRTCNDSGLLMRMVSDRLSDSVLVRCLHNIWHDLDTNALRTPRHLVEMIYACVKSKSNIEMGLNLLELIPRPMLRDWICAMSATGKEKHRVSQLGQRGPLYLSMWFRLLYQLDIRTNAMLDEQGSLCHFTFHRVVRAHLDHDHPPFTMVIALLYCLLGHESFAKAEASIHLYDYIESGRIFSASGNHKNMTLDELLTKLMYDLDKASLPNHGVLELLIPHLDDHKGFRRVSHLVEQLRKHKIKLSDTTFLTRYTTKVFEEISQDTDITRLGRNLASFKLLLNPQAALGAASTILQARLKDAQARRSFNHILAGARYAHIVPLAYRNLTADLPKHIQVELIHQFAYQYAMDRTRSIEQNWRSLRYLYMYLDIHELPIQPLFTKAIVSVCITRPLAENRFVSQKKAVWVCKLVAKVEGEIVARQLEQYFWAWRGDLILEAKKALVQLGVYDDARVSIMERLKLLDERPAEWRENATDLDASGHERLGG